MVPESEAQGIAVSPRVVCDTGPHGSDAKLENAGHRHYPPGDGNTVVKTSSSVINLYEALPGNYGTGNMTVTISETKDEMGRRAATCGAESIRRALREKGEAAIIVATGASQFEMLEELVRADEIDWSKVTAFHLDEYIGIPVTHKASFRRYLKERFVERLSVEIGRFHYIQTENNPAAECRRLGGLISQTEIDVAFIGIGENGHIAFNDPPADFDTEEPYIVVQLDEACRRQQMGEGWFPALSAVPEKAISMSVRQIMKSNAVICTVPDVRKADAVKKTLEEPVTPQVPATILQQHPNCHLFLDTASAQELNGYG